MNTDSPEAIHVFALPYDNTRDVFVRLWRTSLENVGVLVHPLPDNSPLRLALGRAPRGKRIVCIHWSTVLYGSKWALKSLALLSVNMVSLVILTLIRGYRIVWVVHNEYAHDYPHPWIDRLGRTLLREVSDVLIVQQESTRSRYHIQYPRKHVAYIPSGCYEGVYGDKVDRTDTLRAKYGWNKNEVVLLSLGMVRPYKRTEALINAICAKGVDARVRLWIVGTAKQEYEKKVRARMGDDTRIVFENRYVEDAEVSALLAAADYAVFYYDASEMTSGGMRLALSYGLPVIIRKIPASEIITTGKNGFVFESDAELAVLLRSVPEPPETEEVLASVASYTWDRAGKEMAVLFASL